MHRNECIDLWECVTCSGRFEGASKTFLCLLRVLSTLSARRLPAHGLARSCPSVMGTNAADVTASFEELLEPWLARQCAKLEMRHPTAVQRLCIPPILRGESMIGNAKHRDPQHDNAIDDGATSVSDYVSLQKSNVPRAWTELRLERRKGACNSTVACC